MQEAEDLQSHILPSLPSISMAIKEGRRQGGWDAVLRLSVELNSSHVNSHVNAMKGFRVLVKCAHVCSCVIKHAGLCSR